MDNQLFVEEVKVPDGKRVCGACGLTKDVSEFYRDGRDNQGRIRYRRDCKLCYNKARSEAKALKAKRPTRRKKK